MKWEVELDINNYYMLILSWYLHSSWMIKGKFGLQSLFWLIPFFIHHFYLWLNAIKLKFSLYQLFLLTHNT